MLGNIYITVTLSYDECSKNKTHHPMLPLLLCSDKQIIRYLITGKTT